MTSSLADWGTEWSNEITIALNYPCFLLISMDELL